ncbi:DNA polymerase III subunit alpha [Streptomyces sp. A0642]|uniref:DNA polymerase III subunit alpha n=1 Tax=Streptomyces sp. A0642 TaxID=2563100 RepID=UPI0010A2702F|nr:DNA polymerase III subunit alpha [Streptomyces sp. A0642]THA72450.1 DNA polymerase III subunit alpha [Streptomyces sp. A0642]
MLRFITSYASERLPGDERRVDGLTLHLPALVEHEGDGTRWLVVPAGDPTTTPLTVWSKALKGGAAGIMGALGDGIFAVPLHRLTEQDLGDGTIAFAYGGYSAIFGDDEDIPTYHEVLDQLEAKLNPPRAAAGFVHLHSHSEYSPLDGLSRMDEITREVVRHGQSAIGITDHGTCAGHPALQRAADAAGIKPVFGIEANLTDDRLMRGETIPDDDPRFCGHTKTIRNEEGEEKEVPIPPSRMLQNYYWHLCLFAENETGLRNIWAASTESFRDGFYGRARMDWDTLQRHSQGVIASTGCLRGPVARAILADDMELARQRLTRLMDIYPDRLYVELQPNAMDDQLLVNTAMVHLAREFDLPLLATVDSHFPTADDADTHDVWIACQTQKDVQDEGDLFSEHLDLYITGEDQVRAGLIYLGQDVADEAIANTTALADRCNARIGGDTDPPSFTGDPVEDRQRLESLCGANWNRLPLTDKNRETYAQRYATEMSLLIEKGFCGYYLMVADYVGWAKDNGILVGPGRGSGGGSLVAYLARITSLDPIKHDLLFERFLTRGRAGLPDFDVDFPASKKADILGYLRQRWGAEHVVTIGSEGRLKNKAVLDNLLRAMKSRLPERAEADLKQVKELIKAAELGTAGLGMSWEDLWVEHGDRLQPYADRYPELFAMAEKLVGRLKSYGRHAAGVVISTGAPLTSWLPMRAIDGEEQMVTQWAMDDVEAVGLVKFDILTLRTLDTVQQCIDLAHERRGVRIDPEAWTEEFDDPMIWEELQAAHTLGVFQIETSSGTDLCKRMQPRNIGELADMITIVRPGPANSGLTDLYLRRRAGEQAVTYPDERLRRVLEPTYGAMIYQEQVMAVTRLLAGYDESEADTVRRILGKKKVSAIQAAGQEFLSRVDMPHEQAEHLWNQMAEFSKYGFNKSHAYAYAFLGYWTAFLKVHYPLEFLVAAMSTVDNDKLPAFVKEARRVGAAVLPPDINASGTGFSADPALYAVRYGLDSVKGVGATAVADLQAGQPYNHWDDFEARKGPKANAGVVALLARIGAFDSLVPNRRGLETKLLARKSGLDARCVHKDESLAQDNLGAPLLPCSFDWATEPAPVNKRTGKKLKPKAPPKRCTKACRQYTAPPPLQIDDVTGYTDEDIRQIEFEMLGTYLTTTPFDRLETTPRERCLEQANAADTGPTGIYVIAGIVTRAHPYKDMGFIDIETEGPTISAAVYRDTWAIEQPRLIPGTLCFAEIRKTDRGLSLLTYQPV